MPRSAFTPNTTGNGLFFGGGAGLLMTQLIGIVSVGVVVFLLSLMFWKIIDAFMGVRVSADEEIEGLDIGEHGNSAYPGFCDGGSKRYNPYRSHGQVS